MSVTISKEIRWRGWNDGIAVFVPSTSETHLLSPQLLPLFSGDTDALDELAAAMAGGYAGGFQEADDEETRLREIGRRLCALKILVADT